MEIFKWEETFEPGSHVSRLWWAYVLASLLTTAIVLGIGGMFLKLWGSNGKLVGKKLLGNKRKKML